MSLVSLDDLPCNELVELVTDYLEGALPPQLVDRFERHLFPCPFCAEYLQQMRRTIGLTGRLREDDLDPAGRDQLLQAFRRWHRPQGD
ncbi:MAG: zf-HC2 domain-containing protein [Actinomycetota bacterium]|nr:zf-HC2 domain-containing protein [Actinomycetota bacterium]